MFPENLKDLTVIPIPKVANTTRCKEFRPVLAVKSRLLNLCDKNSVIVPNQSEFRNQHLSESVFINVCDKWLRAIDKHKVVVAVCLEFRRAVVSVNTDLLLKKLHKMGLNGVVYKWFVSYLKERTQNVIIKNYTNVILNQIIISTGVI